MTQLRAIKAKNKGNILKLLYTNEKLSKKRIALKLGLSFSVLTKLCAELESQGMIVQSEPISSQKAGRKEIAVGINGNYGHMLGIVLNHKKTTFLLTDFSMNICQEVTIPTHSDPTIHLPAMVAQCKALEASSGIRPIGVGISIKGVTDGVSSFSGVFDREVDVTSYLQEVLNLPVVMDNGVRCSAMLYQFTAKDADFVYIKYMLPGIGASIVRDGQVVRGNRFTMADFGHMIVSPDGEFCPICKRRGCLESLISLEKILADATVVFSQEATPILYQLCGGDRESITMERVLRALDAGSLYFNDYFQQVAKLFTVALINTIVICDIQKVVILGDLFKSEQFCGYVRSQLQYHQLQTDFIKIELVEREKEELSAIALALNEFVFSSTL